MSSSRALAATITPSPSAAARPVLQRLEQPSRQDRGPPGAALGLADPPGPASRQARTTASAPAWSQEMVAVMSAVSVVAPRFS